MPRPDYLEPEAERLLAARGVSAEAFGAWVASVGVRRTRVAGVAIAVVVGVVLVAVTTGAVLPRAGQVPPAAIAAVYLPCLILPVVIAWRMLGRSSPVQAGGPGAAMLARAAAKYGTAKYVKFGLRYDGWTQLIAFAEKWEAEQKSRGGKHTGAN